MTPVSKVQQPFSVSAQSKSKMKLSLSTTTLVVALTSLADPTLAARNCNKNVISGAIVRYQVRSAEVVPDIPGICGGLWDNMKKFGECATASNTWCGDAGDGILGWDFTSFVGCGNGMVSSVWWEATKNEWGDIDCEA
ncbi:hypothetical protein FQN54_004906 [Arachnomyces sp. PD_36]|nr:hypothetical protein FQN54_004906 [Arachnomyces sp. PD_36]